MHRSLGTLSAGASCCRRKSMNCAQEQEHLAQAYRHIAELKGHILRQRVILKLALDTGQPSELAESMLHAFEASLRAFEKHRQLISSASLTLGRAMSATDDKSCRKCDTTFSRVNVLHV